METDKGQSQDILQIPSFSDDERVTSPRPPKLRV